MFHLGSLHLYNHLVNVWIMFVLHWLDFEIILFICSIRQVLGVFLFFILSMWLRVVSLNVTRNGNVNKSLMVTFVWKHIVWSQMQSQSVFGNEFSKCVVFLFSFKGGNYMLPKECLLHPKSEELQGYVFFKECIMWKCLLMLVSYKLW